MPSFGEWLFWVVVFGCISVGVLFGLDALGALDDSYSGFIGLGLGACSLFGAFGMVMRDY